jgi:hypothetical protein
LIWRARRCIAIPNLVFQQMKLKIVQM